MLETMIKLAYVLIFVAGAAGFAVIAARMVMRPAAAELNVHDRGPGGIEERP